MSRRALALIAACLRVACVLGLSGAPAAQEGRDYLLVSLSGSDQIALMDPAGERRVAGFASAAGPHEIAVSPDGSMAYVANAGAQHVTAIDLRESRARLFQIAPHRQPHDVRVSPNGRVLWVAVATSNAILELDALTGRILRSLQLDREGAWFVTATPDGRALYVPHLEGKAISLVDVASGRSRMLVEGGAFSGAAVTPDEREVWAIEHEASRILVLSTASNTVAGRIPLRTATFGRLAFAPRGDRAFVVQGQSLLAIDTRARKIVAGLEMPLDGKVIAISSDGTRAAISNPDANRVTLVDLSKMRVERSLETGPAPDGVAWVRSRHLAVHAQTPPVLDGLISPEEKAGATLLRMSRGGAVYLRRSGTALYAGLESPVGGYGNVCIGSPGRMRLLHASAALGEAEFESRGSSWSRLTNFTWVLRDSSRVPPPTDDQKKAHLDARGWLGTAKNGSTQVREFLIHLRPDDRYAAFFFVETAGAGEVSVAPQDLMDGCSDPRMGGPLPDSITLDPARWFPLERLPG